MTDYIRKAVELADGFAIRPFHDNGYIFTYPGIGGDPQELICGLDNLPQWFKDALAAQLVRQVSEAGGSVRIHTGFPSQVPSLSGHVTVYDEEWNPVHRNEHAGDTMNTIKAIVDSKVLA